MQKLIAFATQLVVGIALTGTGLILFDEAKNTFYGWATVPYFVFGCGLMLVGMLVTLDSVNNF